MREILFRGKRKDINKWLEGWYVPPVDYNGIHWDASISYKVESGHLDDVEVIPETVGQYTGLTDMNGKKIFEGDIVYNGVFRTSVEFCNGRFAPFNGEHNIFFADECVVIGNIHDNPELLVIEE